MIDFTNAERRNKWYTGANGGKLCVIYEGEQYMLKFPPHPTKNQEMSYANSCISEYIGSHIFESVGIMAQKTLLGTYKVNGKDRIVVACRDFTSDVVSLQDFASLKNTVIDSGHNGYGTELSEIENTIETQTVVDVQTLKDWFWDVFVIDAFIGNWDRHNGNWGFLYDRSSDCITIAPVFDCGSALFPQMTEENMLTTLTRQGELNHRIFNVPLSSIKENDKKINYYEFITSLKKDECNEAIKRIVPKINMSKISDIISEIPCISVAQKVFYETILSERKKMILDVAFSRLQQLEPIKEQKEKVAPKRNVKL